MAWTSRIQTTVATGRAWASRIQTVLALGATWRSRIRTVLATRNWSARIQTVMATGREWRSRIRTEIGILSVPAGVPAPPTAGSGWNEFGVYAGQIEICPKPIKVLKDSAGETVDCISGPNIEWGLEQGWTFDAEAHGHPDLTYSPDNTWRAILDDGMGGAITSPPLVVSDPRTQESTLERDSSSLGGMDRTSWLLGDTGQSFPTFALTTSTAIADAVAARAGVAYSGLLDYPVLAEEVKQSKLGDALWRLARACGYTWFIDRYGVLRFIPFALQAGSGYRLPSPTVKRETNPSERKTQFRWGKESSLVFDFTRWFDQAGPRDNPAHHVVQFPTPMTAVQVTPINTNGFAGSVSFFNGDPSGNGDYITTYFLDPTIVSVITPARTGTWPATHAVVTVVDPALDGTPIVVGIRFRGSDPNPLPSGLERRFLYPSDDWYDTGATPTRRSEAPIIGGLYPSAAHLAQWAPRLAAYHNRETDFMTYEGAPFLASIALGDAVSRSGWPDALVAQISWPEPGPDSAPTTNVKAYVI